MPPPDPNASDWSELDLLTIAEATERLDVEEAALRSRIDELADAGDAGALAAAQQRLELLTLARERAHSTRVRIEPGRVRSPAEIDATPGPLY